MKKIHTLQDTLALQLEALYFAECKIRKEFSALSEEANSPKLKDQILHCGESATDKLLKLDRIFNYLMHEPELRKNKVVIKLLEDTTEMLALTESPHLRDILLVSCLQNVNAYKISLLKIAYMFTLELELDTAADLIQQVLESELDTSKALSRLAIDEFNKSPGTVRVGC